MAIIHPAGSLLEGTYFPFIQVPGGLSRKGRALAFDGCTLVVFTRPPAPREEIRSVHIGLAPNGILAIDPGPFKLEVGRDKAPELLLIEEFCGDPRNNWLVIDGPRLASVEFAGHYWLRVSLALAPTGWARDVAAQFVPGKDGLQQVFSLPQ